MLLLGGLWESVRVRLALELVKKVSSPLCVSIVPPLKEEGRAPFPASDLGQVLSARSSGTQAFTWRLTPRFSWVSSLRMQVIGLLRHTCKSQFSVLSHVFGFISGENLDKIQYSREDKDNGRGIKRGEGTEERKNGLLPLKYSCTMF